MSIDNGWDSIWQNGPAPTDPVHQLGDANAKIRELQRENNELKLQNKNLRQTIILLTEAEE